MNLHSLKNTPGARRPRMRVGRGESSGKGKTSGKGNKGQMARSGHYHKPTFEGGQMRLIRRIPKRGFTHPRNPFIPVNLSDLARLPDAQEITAGLLKMSGLAKGTGLRVKILGTGDISRKLTVKAHAFSAAARAKIEAAGGSCEIIA